MKDSVYGILHFMYIGIKVSHYIYTETMEKLDKKMKEEVTYKEQW